jgi:hypothetical protein
MCIVYLDKVILTLFEKRKNNEVERDAIFKSKAYLCQYFSLFEPFWTHLTVPNEG